MGISENTAKVTLPGVKIPWRLYDKKTGKADYNMQLSEKRARAVAKELIEKYGISSSQITIEWRGCEEQPYSENNWNRVVIMSANK